MEMESREFGGGIGKGGGGGHLGSSHHIQGRCTAAVTVAGARTLQVGFSEVDAFQAGSCEVDPCGSNVNSKKTGKRGVACSLFSLLNHTAVDGTGFTKPEMLHVMRTHLPGSGHGNPSLSSMESAKRCFHELM